MVCAVAGVAVAILSISSLACGSRSERAAAPAAAAPPPPPAAPPPPPSAPPPTKPPATTQGADDGGGGGFEPSPADERSVYNAVFDPASTRLEPFVRIPDKKPITLRFFIGPRDVSSALTSESSEINKELLTKDRNLTVAIYCDLCETNRVQLATILYHQATRRSTEARFSIVADRARTKNGVGSITIDVSENGQEFNNITIQPVVGDGNAGPDGWQSDQVWNPPPSEPDPVDFLLTADSGPGGTLQIACKPIHARLVGLVGGLCDAGPFKTGPTSANHLKSVVTTVFSTLKAQASPFDDKLRQHLGGGANAPPPLQSLDNMPESDALALLKTMVAPAQLIYKDLFLDGDSRLETIIEKVESENLGRPTRVLVLAGDVAVPWQLLHTTGPINADDVWGFKFDLTVLPLRPRAGRIATSAPNAPDPLALFAVYGNKSVDETVYTLGQNNLRALSQLGEAPTPVLSRQAFIDAFTNRRDKIRLLATYTHGHSGISVVGEQATVGLAADPAGPRIDFDVNSYVSARDLEELQASQMTPSQIRKEFFLSRRPVVMLNACETGASAYTASAGNGFPEVFLQLGARGVVTTEGPVPVYFGYYFGRDLLERMVKGQRFSTALLEARRAMWGKHNPLGLLYGYFGNPYARGL